MALVRRQSTRDQITPHLMKQVTAALGLFQTLLERLNIMAVAVAVAHLIGLTPEQLGAWAAAVTVVTIMVQTQQTVQHGNGIRLQLVLQILAAAAEEAGGAVPQLMADQALLFSILVLHRT